MLGAFIVLLFAISIGTLILVIRKTKSRQCHKFKMNQSADTECKVYEEVNLYYNQNTENETSTNVAYATWSRKINQSA